jgi:2-hydroxy-3-keto-5-methylthiopentenyl-1-phosphate phosphatase
VRLVLDWDGTCTVSDSLVDAIHRFGDERVLGAGHGSYGESLAAEVGSIRADAATVSAWAAEHVEVRPGLHALAARYRPVIVSSGLPQLIAPVLAREGLELEVRSNDADPEPGGWRLRFRDVGPCPVCGDMCKRRSLPEGRPLVYAGDGVSDRCAARAADRVFARAWLAAQLRREGAPYEAFETLDDIAAALS